MIRKRRAFEFEKGGYLFINRCMIYILKREINLSNKANKN